MFIILIDGHFCFPLVWVPIEWGSFFFSPPLYPNTPALRNIFSMNEPSGVGRTSLFIHFFLFLTQGVFLLLFLKADAWRDFFYLSVFVIQIFLPPISSCSRHFSFPADSSFTLAESVMSDHCVGNALRTYNANSWNLFRLLEILWKLA